MVQGYPKAISAEYPGLTYVNASLTYLLKFGNKTYHINYLFSGYNYNMYFNMESTVRDLSNSICHYAFYLEYHVTVCMPFMGLV